MYYLIFIYSENPAYKNQNYFNNANNHFVESIWFYKKINLQICG